MKIISSNVQMASQRQAVETHEKRESLRAWVGSRRPDFEGDRQAPGGREGGGNAALVAAARDQVTLSAQAGGARAVHRAVPEEGLSASPEDEMKLEMLIKVVELFTGKKLHLMSLSELRELNQRLTAAHSGEGGAVKAEGGADAAQAQAQAQAPAGFGIEYDYFERRFESEQTTFNASGVVRTADGKEINFDVALSMSRSFMQEQSVSLRLGDAQRQMKDPLVVNFNGNAAQLTETKFAFDIDVDGETDQISFVGPGSGFLALDRNNDGRINDGSELFGAQSGDGFGDLAAYDADGNNWIDENDPVYERLRIWSRDAAGNDQLVGLGAAGVGAIYLGNVATDFSLKDDQNQTHGQIRQTGVWLGEEGGVGTIQKIDLAV